jgi:beta-barrel assembly-enhancing protease
MKTFPSLPLVICLVQIWTLQSYAQFGLPKIPSIPKIPSLPSTPSTPTDVLDLADNATQVAKGLSGIGLQEELAIGESVSVEIIAAYGGLWKDEAAHRRVNLMGKTLGSCSDRPLLNYRFGILNSTTINGFSAPGGWVFVTRGAYAAAVSDDQLAGILAHEITHISRRHALRIISRNEALSGILSTAAGSSTDFGPYDLGIDKISQTLFKFGYDAGSEFEADLGGKWTATSAGYHPDGLRDFLIKLQTSGAVRSETFSTHPELSERIARLSH